MADIDAPQRLHQLPDRLILAWRYQKVDVIGHQHIGMKAATVLRQPLAHLGQEKPAVGITEEDRLLVVAPLNDVMRFAGKGQARSARHEHLQIGREG